MANNYNNSNKMFNSLERIDSLNNKISSYSTACTAAIKFGMVLPEICGMQIIFQR